MLPTLDLRPLQEGHATRGIGRYVATLAATLPFPRVIVWRDLPLPPPSALGDAEVVAVKGSPRGGRAGWIADAFAAPSDAGLVHLPVPDVRLSNPQPAVITAFDAIPLRFKADYPSGRIGAVRQWADARVARRVQHVLTISHASADDLVRYLGLPRERLRVVPLAAGPPWPEPSPTAGRHAPESTFAGRRYVVASGGFGHRDPRKRLGDLLAALAQLPQDVGLVVTGARGPFEASFCDQARDLGLAHRVSLTGQVDAEALVELYAGAAAFAFPSAWEGFGLPLLEAMSVGLPCVVAQGGALPEVAGDGAAVVPVGDPLALARALADVLEDGGRAQEASLRATARAATFPLARFAEAHMTAYAELQR